MENSPVLMFFQRCPFKNSHENHNYVLDWLFCTRLAIFTCEMKFEHIKIKLHDNSAMRTFYVVISHVHISVRIPTFWNTQWCSTTRTKFLSPDIPLVNILCCILSYRLTLFVDLVHKHAGAVQCVCDGFPLNSVSLFGFGWSQWLLLFKACLTNAQPVMWLHVDTTSAWAQRL